METHWAGVPFLIVGHRDGRFVRAPGLFAFVRRDGTDGDRAMLFIDHADWIAFEAGPSHPRWSEAMAMGCNEVHISLKPRRRIDRLILRAHIIKRVQPALNDAEQGIALGTVTALRAHGSGL